MQRWLQILFRYLIAATRWLPILARWYGGVILSLFALIPACVLFLAIRRIIGQPASFEWEDLLVLGIFGGLLYFLALLAFRAFTGRGRKNDDGLLPPWAMKGAIHVFGVIGALMLIAGVVEKEMGMALGGIAYCAIAYSALLTLRARRKNVD